MKKQEIIEQLKSGACIKVFRRFGRSLQSSPELIDSLNNKSKITWFQFKNLLKENILERTERSITLGGTVEIYTIKGE